MENMKSVYDITKPYVHKTKTSLQHQRQGWYTYKVLTKEGEVSARWKQRFCEVLNRPKSLKPADVENTGIVRLDIDASPPTFKYVKIQKNWCTVTVAPTIEHHGGHSWTPCKPEVRPGAREESASPAWLAAPAMNARDTTKVYIWRLEHWMWTDTI